jgi:hypothetical protein
LSANPFTGPGEDEGPIPELLCSGQHCMAKLGYVMSCSGELTPRFDTRENRRLAGNPGLFKAEGELILAYALLCDLIAKSVAQLLPGMIWSEECVH